MHTADETTLSTMTAEVPEPTSGQSEASSAAWYALAVLTMVTLFAFIDRQIFRLLGEEIRRRLGLSDLQLGLLQGTGIAIFALVASYPLAWLADRFDRRLVLAGCVILWSVAVAACGLAQNFQQLFIASAMVGAGEAGLIPIVFSLIPELFGEKSRQLANSIFALAASAGGSLALILSGQLIEGVRSIHSELPAVLRAFEVWRLSFFAAAVPAPLMLALIATIAIRRTRVAVEVKPQTSAPPSLSSLTAHIRQHRLTFLGLYAGIGLWVFGNSAVVTWIAIICLRMYGQTASQVGRGLGLATLLAIPLGFVLSLYITRRYSNRVGTALAIRVVWVVVLSWAFLFVAQLFTTSANQLYLIAFFINATNTTANMVLPTAMQNVAPSHLRARIFSIQAVVATAFAASAGPLVGLLSDQMKGRSNGLLLAATAVALPALLAAAALLRASEPGYVKTVEDAARVDALGVIPAVPAL